MYVWTVEYFSRYLSLYKLLSLLYHPTNLPTSPSLKGLKGIIYHAGYLPTITLKKKYLTFLKYKVKKKFLTCFVFGFIDLKNYGNKKKE